ncbi:hypothetical protein GCM10011517_08370 [Actibacterium pelagium]|uniref:Uncharacterized protein n=1 Tax=Actibacterium pelagium TaxID=2029103 RepID=A0A917ACP6_9RHOB|nr:hypothetical protein GCM10011517_08370 [Actibacterium pelagium]
MPALAVTQCHASKHQDRHTHVDKVLTTEKGRPESAPNYVNQNDADEPQKTEPADECGQADQPVRYGS